MVALTDSAPLWSPSPTWIEATRIAKFMRANGHDAYASLYRWSVDQPDDFWPAVAEFCGLGPLPAPVLQRGATFEHSAFFPNATLNVAEVILNGRGVGAAELMYIALDERNPSSAISITRGEARRRVGEIAAALRADGVGVGDRVAAWLPNGIEAQLLMLATASLGAVFCSTSPDFGVDGVLDRFAQIEPTVLVVCDGYFYNGRTIDIGDKVAEVRRGLPTVRRVVQVSVVDSRLPSGISDWDTWTEPHIGATLEFRQLPFAHPWYILFSSGTTGLPKCIVHRCGGVLLQHIKEQQLLCDIGIGDRAMYFTTTGWMMWNWVASIPASGATAVLYDGSPFAPSPSTLFDIVDAHRLTFLGVGAKFIDSCRKSGLSPRSTHQLSRLRTIASTGSPLSIEGFSWVYDEVKADVHLASISGGTDLCACFVGGDPTSPVYAGEIQRPALGMAVAVFDTEGRPLPAGERGELVCTAPFPSQPIGFWNDPDGARYHGAYFERFPGVWAHGDFASWTDHGGMVIHGRADTTLNPGGVRIGTAEIYRQVEQIPEVLESLVFGQDWEGDSRIVLLVRLGAGAGLDAELQSDIKQRIRVGCTPRHVPALIVAVEDLPRTRSGKLAEMAVADIVNGRIVRNTAALANPESLEMIAAGVTAASTTS